jgi:hypothetical protein
VRISPTSSSSAQRCSFVGDHACTRQPRCHRAAKSEDLERLLAIGLSRDRQRHAHGSPRGGPRAGGPHEFRADMSLKGRVAHREYQNGLIWLLIDYFARGPRQASRCSRSRGNGGAAAAGRTWLATTGTDTIEPWPRVAGRYDGATWFLKAVRDGWSVRVSAVRDAAARRRGDEPAAGVVHHLAGRGIHKHKTRADGQPVATLCGSACAASSRGRRGCGQQRRPVILFARRTRRGRRRSAVLEALPVIEYYS